MVAYYPNTGHIIRDLHMWSESVQVVQPCSLIAGDGLSPLSDNWGFPQTVSQMATPLPVHTIDIRISFARLSN